jgi:hypothetical protein
MGQTDPEMIAVGRYEHLRFMAEAAERHRMDDPVAITMKCVARAARAAAVLDEGPAARL